MEKSLACQFRNNSQTLQKIPIFYPELHCIGIKAFSAKHIKNII
jgi:hypothetical protein